MTALRAAKSPIRYNQDERTVSNGPERAERVEGLLNLNSVIICNVFGVYPSHA